MPVTGFENHSLNSLWDWNTLGMRKCISDHSSIRLFCRGVPVSRRRLEPKFDVSFVFFSSRKRRKK